MKELTKINYQEFKEIIKDIVNNETVLEMKEYNQHFDVSCFDHCLRAAYYSFIFGKKLKLDYKSMARAAMVHDMFLYEWRKPNPYHKLHAFIHGDVACDNASKLFTLNEKEKDIIRRHMFPITLIPPKSKEGLLFTIIDKFSTIIEFKEYLLTLFKSIQVKLMHNT